MRKNNGVSIILPTYNRGKVIERSIASIQAQTYKEWELISIDDGSTDETENIIREYKDDRIRYYKNTTNG